MADPAETQTAAATDSPATEQAGEAGVDLSLPDRIVFFDGVCGMCNHTVDFLIRRDPQGMLRFAPLQGSTAAGVLPQDLRDRLDTIVYARHGQMLYRSSAVLRVLRDLGGVVGLLAALCWLIPAPVRDLGYRGISTTRYRLFGKHEACRLPTPEERSRFLE